MCNVLNPSVFDINKDVHERELMLIDDIPEDDVTHSPQRLTTLAEELHAKETEGGENVEPRD